VTERWTSLRLSKTVTVCYGNGIIGWPLVGPDAIYAEDWRDEMVRLDRNTLRVVWRRPADKSRAAYLCGSVLLTGSMSGRIGARRAESGEWVWQKETRFGTHLWRGRLVVPGEEFQILEPETGEVEDSFPVQGGVNGPGTLCGDILVSEHGEQGDPVKAVNLNERRLVWQRDLLAEMKSQYGVEQEVPVISLVAGTMRDRFIATRGGSTFACSLEDGANPLADGRARSLQVAERSRGSDLRPFLRPLYRAG